MLSADVARRVAEEYGTPTYVYSERKIREEFARLKTALGGLQAEICFAVKACSNLSILKLFKEFGAGFDIVSGGELRRVQAIGGDPRKVVFSGVGKTREEIVAAIDSEIHLINIESESELDLVQKLAGELGRSAQIALRVNPYVDVDTHPYLATGEKDNKFGIPAARALELGQRVVQEKRCHLRGLACHIGSQIGDLTPLKEAYTQVINLGNQLRGHGAEIRYLDFGGGFRVSYSGAYEPLDVGAFGSMLREITTGTDYQLIFEPGKFLIAEAGGLLSRILYIKEGEGKRFLVVDSGMNDLIRPALYGAKHAIDHFASVEADPQSASELPADVVGPVCESGCFFAKNIKLPFAQEGDLVFIRDAGAYGFSMASNYNTRRLPAEVLIADDGSLALIRRRQSYEEIFAAELECLSLR